MVNWFYVSFTLVVSWTYISIASVKQQHAVIKYFDEQYVSNAWAFTGRRKRGDAYLTNVTVVFRSAMNNNVTLKIAADIKSIGTIVFHEMRMCDGFQISWVNSIRTHYSNYTDCPIRAGTYIIFNLELPPKNFPLVVPKGEGTLHAVLYVSRSKKIMVHGMVKVVSS